MLKGDNQGAEWMYGPPRDTIIETVNDLLLPVEMFTTGYELVFGKKPDGKGKLTDEDVIKWLGEL